MALIKYARGLSSKLKLQIDTQSRRTQNMKDASRLKEEEEVEGEGFKLEVKHTVGFFFFSLWPSRKA